MVATLSNTQVRIATIGSVDDGKSTLIGRLLHDSKGIFEDQLSAIGRASKKYGDGTFNLALLTDGLRAEREQGITIDVAYRYFATPRRSFVLADTPGHAQFTRNMVTGASVSDVAVVLVDARHGVVEQTRRHVSIAALLRVSHLVLAVNKMDLVGWDEDVFDSIVTDVGAILESVDARVPLRPVPISASNGDNVVDRSVNMPWYDGPTVLDLLETVDIAPQAGSAAVLPVQWVNRAHGGSDYRGYAGPLHGGVIRIGDAVTVLPKGTKSMVSGITVAGSPAEVAVAGDAVAVELADQVDVGRGDVIVGAGDPAPRATTALEADICWLGETDLRPDDRIVLRHLSSEVTATVTSIRSRLDLDSLSSRPAGALVLNDIARVTLSLDRPVVATTYEEGRATGSVVAIDPVSNATVGALMIRKVENA
ncbi:MAG: sulfate adenylyltransferase [Actinobacteria bacterium]|jgi:sulfate adenylyltransferase large subunit|nr:sulfate adenylyltransferase [Actinomycetota bacterium]NBU16229.1 sulfate adenylyltransferase [Actinomycetota bacterium]